MVRIKKRASKRLGVAQREKVKKKVREHHRKQRKEAKTNPQWKSKIKKDPGIPNSFPYKEQMLNEIEATKQRQLEEKLAAREAKRAERKLQDAKGKYVINEEEPEEEAESDIELDEGLLEDEDVTGLPMTASLYRGDLAELLQSNQIKTIVMTLDARDPQSFRSPWLEAQIKKSKKKLVLALGRADMVPAEALANWVAFLATTCKVPVFPIASLPDQIDQVTGAEQLVASLDLKGKGKGDVAVVGLAYSGRSTVADAILNALGSPEEEEDDETWPNVLDTPALVPQKGSEAVEASDDEDTSDEDDEDEDDDHKFMLKMELKSMQTLMRNQGHVQRIKEPLPLAWALLSRVSHPEDLMLIYNVPAFGSFQIEKASLADQELEEEEQDRLQIAKQREKVHADAEEFLIALARASGRMKRRNMPDPVGASRVLLRDWSHQMLGYYTQLPKVGDVKALEKAKAIVADLSSSIVLPRKEWRKKYSARELRLKPISSVLGRDALVLDQVEMLPPPPEEESDEEEEMLSPEEDDEDEVEDELVAQDWQDVDSDAESEEAAPVPKSIKSILKGSKRASKQQEEEDSDIESAQPSRKERRTTTKKARISTTSAPSKAAASSKAKRSTNGTSASAASATAARAAVTGPAPGESYDFGAFF